MPKTLDQYTLEQQDDMRGMWMEHAATGTLCILSGTNDGTEAPTRKVATLNFRKGQCVWSWPAYPDTLTPRFDLPRAWTPDEKPPAGRWQKVADPDNSIYRYFIGEPEALTHE